MKNLLSLCVCLLLAVPSQARIITVNWDGSGDYLTIQAAIDDSNDGDIVEIQPGVYMGDGNRDIDFGGRAIAVRSTDPNDPNIVAATIIDCNGTEAERNRAFYFHTNEGSNSIVAGLTIKSGYAFGSWPKSGLAPSCGGGVCCVGASPTISNCTFSSNSASDKGGGIYLKDTSNPIITNCSIVGNSAGSRGGGIYCNSSNPLVSNCTIIDNSTDFFGGGISGEEGASPIVTNCTITGNSAGWYGGGLYECQGDISNCTISGNSSGSMGGGLYGCNGNISNSAISANLAGTGGGLKGCWGKIVNCIISGNSANSGGALFGCHGQINNCTITGNWGGDFGVISYCNGTVTNCIIWANRSSDSILYSSTVPLYSCVQDGSDGTGSISSDPCFILPGYWDPNGTTNDANDDFWVEGDYHLQSVAGRWDPNTETWVTDANNSPAIDAGDPNSDWTTELWPHGKRINMGAYGGTPQASMSWSYEGNIADFSNDDSVDYKDLMLFAEDWLYQQVLLYEDLDRNAIVDFTDFAIFANNWLWKE